MTTVWIATVGSEDNKEFPCCGSPVNCRITARIDRIELISSAGWSWRILQSGEGGWGGSMSSTASHARFRGEFDGFQT
jgi:hypothetical protein